MIPQDFSAFLSSLETLDLAIHQVMTGLFGGTRPSPLYGSSPEFADFRDYLPGDDPRRIDWNLAARFDKHYIRQFVDERQLKNIVYLDTSASMGMNRQKEILAKQLAASMAFIAIENMDQVMLNALAGSHCRTICEKIVGREAFYASMEALYALPFQGTCELVAAIRNDPEQPGRNGISILISDFLTDSDWKSAVEEWRIRGRQVALIQVLAEEEENPLSRGRHQLSDIETSDSARLEIDHSMLLAYRQAVAEMRRDIADFCASRSIVFVAASSGECPESVILKKGLSAGLIR